MPMRFRTAVLMGAMVSLLAAGGGAMADSRDDEGGSYIAVVTADDVYVRSGASDGYYPFGRVHEGDLVKVVGDRFNFARVHTVGPTFPQERYFGYLIYPKTQPGRFRLSEDGTRGTTLSRMDVLAPNLTTDFEPNDSWKPLLRLEADKRVTVLERSETRNNIVLRIALPETAEGWINMRNLRPADEAEREKWERILAGGEEPREDEQPQPDVQPDAQAEAAEEPEQDVLARDAPERVTAEAEQGERESAEQDEPAEEAPAEESAEQAQPIDEDPQPQPRIEDIPREDDEQADDEQEPARDAERAEEAPDADEEREPIEYPTLDDLEAAFEALRDEPIEHAEVTPLRDMYRDLARRHADDDRIRQFAEARAEQLEIWANVQQRRAEIAELRTRAEMASERTEAVRLALDAEAEYTAVGRLGSSTIYDGRRLPHLKRLRAPGSGRTVAYLMPDDGFDLDGMLGQLIGVVGERRYEPALRLHVIEPRRIDILAPEG